MGLDVGVRGVGVRGMGVRIGGLRLLYATLAATALVAISSAAILTTDQPRLISLFVEPLSLFLMPGLLVSLMTAGLHDYSLDTVLIVSFVFYLIAFYLLLHRRARPHARPFS